MPSEVRASVVADRGSTEQLPSDGLRRTSSNKSIERVLVWKKPPCSLRQTKDLQAQKSPLSQYPLGRALEDLHSAKAIWVHWLQYV